MSKLKTETGILEQERAYENEESSISIHSSGHERPENKEEESIKEAISLLSKGRSKNEVLYENPSTMLPEGFINTPEARAAIVDGAINSAVLDDGAALEQLQAFVQDYDMSDGELDSIVENPKFKEKVTNAITHGHILGLKNLKDVLDKDFLRDLDFSAANVNAIKARLLAQDAESVKVLVGLGVKRDVVSKAIEMVERVGGSIDPNLVQEIKKEMEKESQTELWKVSKINDFLVSECGFSYPFGSVNNVRLRDSEYKLSHDMKPGDFIKVGFLDSDEEVREDPKKKGKFHSVLFKNYDGGVSVARIGYDRNGKLRGRRSDQVEDIIEKARPAVEKIWKDGDTGINPRD